MALIKCPECGNEVSTMAESCPKCGYPIKEFANQYLKKLEIERLTNKIIPINFKCPKPRLLVCIRCATPFSRRTGKPLCKCGFPGTEVDYPERGYRGELGQFQYIIDHDIVPRNIGDTESEEYQTAINEIRERNKYRLEHNMDEIVAIPPDPKDFGVVVEYSEPYKYTPPAPAPEPSLPRCPFCQSIDLTKISSLGKVAKISLFGIFGADDLGKTYKCNNCGGKF